MDSKKVMHSDAEILGGKPVLVGTGGTTSFKVTAQEHLQSGVDQVISVEQG